MNHLFAGRPIYVQRREFDDAPGVPFDGEIKLLPWLRLVPALGHTRGLQVIVVETDSNFNR